MRFVGIMCISSIKRKNKSNQRLNSLTGGCHATKSNFNPRGIMTTFLRSLFNVKSTGLFGLVLALFFVTPAVRGQVSAYQVDQLPLATAATPAALAAPYTTLVSGVQTSGVYSTPLPFDFTFGGTAYPAATNVHVSVKGFMAFGTAPLATTTTPISTNGSSGIISIFGSDLRMTATNWIRVKTEGAAPNRIFKVEWVAYPFNSSDPNTTGLIMQAWLYETSHIIEFHYRTWNSAQNTSFATFPLEIGLRGATNADFKNLVHPVNSDWPAAPATMALGTNNNDFVALRRANTRILTGSNRLFRFTPVTCFAPTVNPVAVTDFSSATVTWNPASPVPGNNYNWEIRTSGAPGTPGAVQSGTNATSPVNLTGLSGNTTYYVYVQSQCAPGNASAWSVAQVFTTPCTPVFPYIEEFETVTTPALPACTSIQNIGTGNNWETTNAFEEGFFDQHLAYQGLGGEAANVWFFTRGLSLTGGVTYRLQYDYGGSTTFATIVNRMEVRLGTGANNAAMVAGTQLIDHNDIKDSPVTNVINFTPATTGTYYIGFRGYSAQNNGRMFLDNIYVDLATCFPPTALSSGTVTPTSATISWTPPSTVPGAGYQYYLSTVNTAPSASTLPTANAPTNIVNLTGLTQGTTYYFWVRSNCGSGDLSGWSLTAGTFTTPTLPAVTYCIPSGAGFAQDPNGITNVTVGTINNTTGIELPDYYGNYSNLITSVAQGANVPISVTLATGWTYDVTVWVDWNNDGDFADTGELVVQGNSSSAVPTTVAMSFTVPLTATLGAHRMRVGGIDFGPLTNPCRTGTWQAFEDYTLFVTPAPAPMTLSALSVTTCPNIPSTPVVTLTSALANYTSYSWSPVAGVTGNATTGWQFAPNATTVYTLTGFNSTNFESNTTTLTVNVNQPPTPIVISPAAPTVCQAGPAVALVASGGIVTGQLIHYEGFNSGFPAGWDRDVVINAAGGTPAAANWAIGANGSAPWLGAIFSNDNSSYVYSDSDAAGFGSNVTTRLTSLPIAVTNPNFPATEPQYTSASLSFWHFFDYLGGEQARVLVATGPTYATWTNLATYTSEQGASNNFQNVVLNLTPYIGQNIRIRFEYANATWDWGWAIDNFLVTGSGTSAITWSPVTGLYTDAAATIPYTGTGAATVYAMPSTNTQYTASATLGSCTTQTLVDVTVSPIVAGGVLPLTQNACSSASNLTLTGTTGTVTGWEYATNAAFTVGVTPIPASASATLTSAQIGTFAGTRYFRAVVTNGSCTAYSNIVSITFNTKIWNGSWNPPGAPTLSNAVIFQANYTQASGTLNACSVRVESGNVVFNPNTNLVVQNEVVRVGGTLTFENNASLVQIDDDAVNSGYIVYKRDSQPMIQYDFTYWSSPLYPQTLVGLSPLTLSDKYFTYDPVIDNYVQVNANTIMDPGRGYIIRAPQGYNATPQVFPGVFNGGSNDGVPNNGVINIDIVSPTTESYNLIGNPYPSAIDANDFYAENSSLIDGNFYFWTHNTPIDPLNYTQSDYAVWNSSGGVGTAGGGVGNSNVPDGSIAAGQGFFVVGNVVTAGSPLTFNNNMRITGSNGMFFRPDGTKRQVDQTEKHRVWLELTNAQGAYKQTLVGYIAGATHEKEPAFDAVMIDGGNSVSLYSVVGSHNLAIQGRALPFDTADVVPLGFSVSTGGTYTISLSNFDGLFDNQDVYLEDLYLGTIQNLKTANYSFTAPAGIFNDRFQLRYNENALGVQDNQFDDNSVVIYKNDSGIQINSGTVDIKDVKVFDMRGRLVTSKEEVASTSLTVSLDVPQQVLIVQVTSQDNRVVTKKIVY